MNARSLHLRLKRQLLSIKDLPDITLPPFTIITGVNGSGKSHLLQAIATGEIEVEGFLAKTDSIRLFDSTNFHPTISESANPHSLYSERGRIVLAVCAQLDVLKKQLTDFFTAKGISGVEFLTNPSWLSTAKADEIRDVLPQRGAVPMRENAQLAHAFVNVRRNWLQGFAQYLKSHGALAMRLQPKLGQERASFVDITAEDIRDALAPPWHSPSMLQLPFAEWFAHWHAEWEYNLINQYYSETGKAARPWLSEEAFRRRFGPEPWIVTNKVLEEAGVRYRFNRPEHTLDTLHENFQLKLEDPADGTSISAQNLSPGEKIFLAITFLLYQTRSTDNYPNLPTLLLLDEVDAPLHPSLTKSLLRILTSELAEKCGTSIILTTHSPSTVALAPPESIFELVRSPRQIRRITPGAASQILASGFVSISPPDVVVIVESSADLEYYEKLYQASLRTASVPAHPPLKFLSASKSASDPSDGGSTQVEKWAENLDALGLGRFRGLRDKDSGVVDTRAVKVLGRHSIENYLFDPLTLLAYFVHRIVDLPFSTSPFFPQNIIDLEKLGKDDVQIFLNAFLEWIAQGCGKPSLKDSSPVSCSYAGWKDLAIPNAWLETRGHDLESSLRQFVNQKFQAQKRGAPVSEKRDELIKFQTVAFPQLISDDLAKIFKRLATEVAA